MLLVAFGLLTSIVVFADNVRNMPHTITQPNGKVINCFITGDEFYHRIHDEKGYTIIQNEQDGYFYYGKESGGKVVPSRYIVGSVNPALMRLKNEAKISEELYAERRANYEVHLKSTNGTPTEGLVNAICIYIAFSDDSVMNFNRKRYLDMWSSEDQVSVHDYYKQISNQQLDLRINHFPLSPDSINIVYIDSHPRKYYKPKTNSNPGGYENQAEREHSLLASAVNAIASQIPASLDLDMNDDGVIDNISFIIQGSAPNEDWNTLLWPHQWSLFTNNVSLKGALVNNYFLTLEGFSTATICHELGHVFGAPDLYHYSNSGKTGPTPVGPWCLMAESTNPPQSICGFLKFKYNHWIDVLPEISKSGTYSLKPLLSATNNLYKIKSPYSKTEYFVLEYRKKEGRYESGAPSSGLVVYRINTAAGGNANGPPDGVYVYRPGGSLTETGSLSGAAFVAPAKKAISDRTDPYAFLYNNGAGGRGGLDISDISAAGDSITFQVNIINLFPPTNLTYSAGVGIVDLQWSASAAPDLKGYNIYRDGVLYGSSTQTSFRDNEVVNNVTYTYGVSAIYSGQNMGESVLSNEVHCTPKGIQTLPYKEDFENIGHGWKIKETVEGFQWGNDSSLLMTSDNKTKYFGANSVAAGIGIKCADYAITPRLNLFGKANVYVHFDYCLKRWQQLDHLKIYYRKNRSESWISIIDLPISGNNAVYKWKKFNLEIPSGSYTSEAQLGFLYDDGTDMGYGAGIDNVLIDEEPISGIEVNANNFEVNIYPNPAGNETTLSYTGNQSGDLTIRLITPDGKLIWSVVRQNGISGLEKISLNGLAGGLYYVVVETGSEVTIKSIIKQN
jgi:M6 family metalloprotease-like protein